ncbi:hypothetical protein PG987_005776 [Apiospora arundinis]
MNRMGDAWESMSGGSDLLSYARSCDSFITLTRSVRPGALDNLVDYLKSILPRHMLSHEPSWSSILAWYEQHLEQERFNVTLPGNHHAIEMDWHGYKFWRVAKEDPACMERACLMWSAGSVEVDPDLAGIGVLCSYCMEAALVTTFFLVLVFLARWNNTRTTTSPASLVIARLVDVHRGALYDMFLGASILCFGVQLATIRSYQARESNTTLFFLVNSLVSSFAFLPLLALCCLVDARAHVRIRYWFFRATAFVLYCLWVAVIWLVAVENPGLSLIFVFIGPITRKKAVIGELLHELSPWQKPYCQYRFDGSTAYLKLAVICVWAVMILPPAMYLVIGVVRLIERLRGSKGNMVSRSVSHFFHVVLPLFCLVGMWTILGLILHIRGVLTLASRDELSLVDINKWEIGQILAALTWMPVVIEMGRIAAVGMRATGFRDVVVEEEEEEAAELPVYKPETLAGNGSYSGHHSCVSEDDTPLVPLNSHQSAQTINNRGNTTSIAT